MRSFKSLSEQEILALAISLEEEDARIYGDFADGLKDRFPLIAEQFRQMRAQEDGHRHRLLTLYQERFGDHIPLLRRQDVKGFVHRRPVWLTRPLGLAVVRKQAATMEIETQRFYEKAARRAADVRTRQLLGDLAEEERKHTVIAETLEAAQPSDGDAAARQRLFVLQVVQPGLAGLMDGSVSTLAPLFAAAISTGNPLAAFLVGLAASLGAGISMGFAEALSDDGSLTGRGHPLARGIVCGLMTTAGGIGHTMPFLIPHIETATTVAVCVVVVELGVIAWVRNKFMDTPWPSAVFQVVFGGVLVFLTGMAIGLMGVKE